MLRQLLVLSVAFLCGSVRVAIEEAEARLSLQEQDLGRPSRLKRSQGSGTTSRLCNKTYVGDFQEIDEIAQKHGQGKCTFDKFGSSYEGQWVNSTPTGEGKIMFVDANGAENTYEGDVVDAIQEGWGTMYFANGDIFEGSWEDGKRLSGTQDFNNGNQYIGELKDDTPHGDGKMIWAEAEGGATYEGSYDMGNMVKGTYTFPNGVVYDGEIKDGSMTGKGEMTMMGGDKVRSRFNNGAACGEGVITREDGARFKSCGGVPTKPDVECTSLCPEDY